MRFDALMYGIELAYLAGKTYSRARKDLVKKVQGIASVANVPEIQAQSELMEQILHTNYLEHAGINEFEHIRACLRDLMKYLPRSGEIYNTDFTDNILSTEWRESELENDDLKNYKAKAEFYIRQHKDNPVIAKLHSNLPLTEEDIGELQNILWSQVGSRQDYEADLFRQSDYRVHCPQWHDERLVCAPGTALYRPGQHCGSVYGSVAVEGYTRRH